MVTLPERWATGVVQGKSVGQLQVRRLIWISPFTG